MIPDNVVSSQIVKSFFKSPDNRVTNRITDYEMGGIALQDTSEGLEYQVWKCEYNTDDSTVYISSEADPDSLFPLITQSDVRELGFTFDQNMRWSLVTLDSLGNAAHHWYDSSVAAYVVSNYSGLYSVKLALDDKRNESIQLGQSDMIFTYTKISGGVFWRTQRERFLVETVGDANLPAGLRITNFGMSQVNRLQWRFAHRRN